MQLKRFDFFRKIPKDLTEATLSGALISLAAFLFVIYLIVSETSEFVKVNTSTALVIDRGDVDDMLRINVDVLFPSVSCEFIEVESLDMLGYKRHNLSRTISRIPLDSAGVRLGPSLPDNLHAALRSNRDSRKLEADASAEALDSPPEDPNEWLTHETFMPYVEQHAIVIVAFVVNWCPWCRRLKPEWDKATRTIYDKHRTDGILRFAKVDCQKEEVLCDKWNIHAFPSIRIFRRGTDEVDQLTHQHAAYYGDRSAHGLVDFAEKLLEMEEKNESNNLGQARKNAARQLEENPNQLALPAFRGKGCHVQGFITVKKVPGVINISPVSQAHSIDYSALNLTHTVRSLTFGSSAKLSRRQKKTLARLHSNSEDFTNRLKNHSLISSSSNVSHHYYMQVVNTEVNPLRGPPAAVYEFTSHSYSFWSPEEKPTVQIQYSLSPVQVVLTEARRPFYRFIIDLCAVVGGVFTVAQLLDSGFYSIRELRRKSQLGKFN